MNPHEQLDVVRKELRNAKMENAKLRRENEDLRTANKGMTTEIVDLKNHIRKTRQALGSDESTWKLYNAPGVCSFCGSITCSSTCFK